MIGMPVVLDAQLADGVMYISKAQPPFVRRGHIILGTRRWNQRERDKEIAIRIVRNGLRDVLEWLGEPVGAAVDDPIPATTTREILATLRSRSDVQLPFAR